MPSSRNNRKDPKKKPLVKKPWTDVQSRPSATSAKKNKSPVKNFFTSAQIVQSFEKKYPDAHCALHHKNAFELLVATILSAQCTDERVNKVTPDLFKKFPTPKDMAEGSYEEIEYCIRSVNFYKNKTKNLKACAQTLVSNYGGEVPQLMEDLIQLAGVGRKTANVVLGNAFQIASGVVVDTHVARLSQRLGWSNKKTPEDIEKDLIKIIPKESWIQISHFLITHGRTTCKARNPQCETCFLFDGCPRKGV